MNGGPFEITTLIALGGLLLTLGALLGGVLYRLGALTSRADGLDRRFDLLSVQISELREENRRNHQDLLQALAHHTHDPDTGFAIFRIPPGTENPAA